MDTNSPNGGSLEPIPTPSHPAADAGAQAPTTAAQPEVQSDAQPDTQVAPPDTQSVHPNAPSAPEPASPAGTVVAVEAWPVSPSLVPQAEGLSPPQRSALAALAGGQSLACVVQVAGVSASTLYRWRTKDPAFIAALNAWRSQTNNLVRDRLLAMTDQAAHVLLGGLRAGDTKLALSLFKLLGTAAPNPLGPTTADEAQLILGREELQEREKVYTASRDLEGGNLRFAQKIKSNEAWDKQEADPVYQASLRAGLRSEIQSLMESGDSDLADFIRECLEDKED
ncbi:MAG TPA: hypothetical protein VG269_04920 [Tepidisphaeraceae bacterium]|jgi:hypothetical protein|nr:hypothetical protein [Tepidisphaeraceae bacterium]